MSTRRSSDARGTRQPNRLSVSVGTPLLRRPGNSPVQPPPRECRRTAPQTLGGLANPTGSPRMSTRRYSDARGTRQSNRFSVSFGSSLLRRAGNSPIQTPFRECRRIASQTLGDLANPTASPRASTRRFSAARGTSQSNRFSVCVIAPLPGRLGASSTEPLLQEWRHAASQTLRKIANPTPSL